jgi:hypothetical protein
VRFAPRSNQRDRRSGNHLDYIAWTDDFVGIFRSLLGKKREGRRAVELLPLEKDAIDAAVVRQYLAAIYAWSGEKDLALKELRRCVSIPGHLTYGQLRLDPMWAPLRSDARFERIVALLAPK